MLTLASGPRAKWIVAGVWLVIAFAAGPLAGRLTDVEENTQTSFLPGGAESVEALDAAEGFEDGSLTPAVVVFHRESGLSEDDQFLLRQAHALLTQDPPEHALPPEEVALTPFGAAGAFAVPLTVDDGDELVEATDAVREVATAGDPDNGLNIKITGPAGYSSDAIEVFDSINGTLLVAAASLVFFLLIAIYRSPIFWAIPFFSVLLAELTSRAMGYGLAMAGVTVNGQSSSILTILVFGAGTDYALLLVARYREELRAHEDKHDAMRRALRKAGPAIVASGLTVVVALLCLSVAELDSIASLGPIGALGILLAVVAMLTMLPALLLLFGRRAFWPFIPRYGSEGTDATHGLWRMLGERISRRPRRVWLVSAGVLLVMAVGLVQLNSDLTTGKFFREDVEAVEGQELLAEGLPAGAAAPTQVIVRDRGEAGAVRAALDEVDGVVDVGDVETGPPGARFDVTLEADPYGEEAFDIIPALRDVARDAAAGEVLVGGPTAEEFDVRESTARDTALILPLTLIVVLVILAVLLRSVLLPLLLIGTVVASFAAALGLGVFLFESVLGFPGIDPALPLYAFVFLVALGIDYNIFLMARVREEARVNGTPRGMIRGLAVTGGVITSAGIVLAGTFVMLAVLPLYTLTEIGLVIALGVLLDTFLVRSVLVPALVLDVGKRVWWPSALAKRDVRPGEPEHETDEPELLPA